MEKPKDKRIRKFLNKPGYHATGSVLSSVEYDKKNAYITLIITDCFKKISLELSTSDKGELSNTKNKLKILKESIELLENELDIAWKWSQYNKKKPNL